jgi:hypothetical protein
MLSSCHVLDFPVCSLMIDVVRACALFFQNLTKRSSGL